MKRFKFSFLAVLAVLAIGLTAATKADVFKKPASEYTCRADVDYINGKFKKILEGTTIYERWNDDFNEPLGSILCPGEGLYCLDLQATGLEKVPVGEEFECTEGNTEFCCAEVLIENQSPCGTDPEGSADYTGFTKKVTIYCKSDDPDPDF